MRPGQCAESAERDRSLQAMQREGRVERRRIAAYPLPPPVITATRPPAWLNDTPMEQRRFQTDAQYSNAATYRARYSDSK